MDYHCPVQLDNSIHHRISPPTWRTRRTDRREGGWDDKSRRSISSVARWCTMNRSNQCQVLSLVMTKSGSSHEVLPVTPIAIANAIGGHIVFYEPLQSYE